MKSFMKGASGLPWMFDQSWFSIMITQT